MLGRGNGGRLDGRSEGASAISERGCCTAVSQCRQRRSPHTESSLPARSPTGVCLCLHLQGLVELTDRHSIQRSIALRLPHEAAAAGKAAGGGGLMTLLTSKT